MKIIANGVDRGLTGRKVRQGLYKIQTRVEKLSYELIYDVVTAWRLKPEPYIKNPK